MEQAPASIRHASSVSSFKSSLKAFLSCARVGAYVCCLCIWIFDVQIYMCVLGLVSA